MPEQRKLLSIDGGGVRGILALRILRRIESILREQSGKPDLVLADFFDFIGGTSTGGFIAAALSIGMSTEELEGYYWREAPHLFPKSFNYVRKLFVKYEADGVRKRLQDIFGYETRLGSDRLKTLLMLVMLNGRTNSPWPITNNPEAKYNGQEFGEESNLNFRLWQLIRGSTAAPYYFEPEEVVLGDQSYLFYDGGITSLNNPAFKLFQMATLPEYRIEWPTGPDKLLLVSVGTGLLPMEIQRLGWKEKFAGAALVNAIKSLMFATSSEVDLQCRGLAKVLAGDPIDSEVGDLIGGSPIGSTPLFSYARYNATLTKKGLVELDCGHHANNEFQLDDLKSMPASAEIGDAVAKLKVMPEHFQDFLA